MEKIMEYTLIQEHDIEMGETCLGETLIVPTDGGTVRGKIKGTIEPIGMGIVYMKDPGKNDLTATALIKTDDGAHIIMETKGIFDVDYETETKMAAGEYVSPDQYYHKGTVIFRTDAEQYKWLERKVCVYDTEIKSWSELLTTVYMF